VVLPSSRIDEGARVENTLVIGGRDSAIERNAQVGSSEDVVNRDFPVILKKGLTVIGSGVSVPRDSRIGAGCLVANRSEKRIASPLNLENGSSYLKE
jgi:UDP-3-O-[3-hydroxymyristoyl] glucosamine N-acyltransferase